MFVISFLFVLDVFINWCLYERICKMEMCVCKTKKWNVHLNISLFLRYLAESNCSTRFCRPLPNRSAKVPNGLLLICECKGRHYYCNYQMFSFLFFCFFCFFLCSSAYFFRVYCLIFFFSVITALFGVKWCALSLVLFVFFYHLFF